MKKTTAKEKVNKKSLIKEVGEPEEELEHENPVESELDPEIAKVLTAKPTKKPKKVDTDYISEFERDDTDLSPEDL